MADTTATPQGESKNPAGSPPKEGADPKDTNPKGSSTDPKQPSAEEIAAIRHDARFRERRQTVKLLREKGFDVTSKNLDEFLKNLEPTTVKPKAKADDAEPDDNSKGKSKAKKGEDDEESAEVKLLRKENEQLKQMVGSLSEASKSTVIDASITRAASGIEFANKAAAHHAITAFRETHRLELADDNRTVRVLDAQGEPVLKGYKEITLDEAFEQFMNDAPHFRKAEAKPGQTTESQKGTTPTSSTMNGIFRNFRRGR